MKFKKKFLFIPLILPTVVLPLTSCNAASNYDDLSLGVSITNNMKQSRIFTNNFGFFGGDDISVSSQDLYQTEGYKNQIELFEDYIRINGPYALKSENNEVLKYIFGRRLVFDLSDSGSTIVDAVKKFDRVAIDYDLLTAIYNVDTKDVNSLNLDDFKNNLKIFIDKGLSLRDNTGMVVIKNHYTTLNESFNAKNEQVNNAIQDVIRTNYWDDQDKLNRINLVDHAKLSKNKSTLSSLEKFSDICLNSDSTLNSMGQLEMLNQLVKSLYPEADELASKNLASSFVEFAKPTHVLSSGNSYVTVDETQSTKVANFQTHLKELGSAKWYFFGDSLTIASNYTKGFKGYVDYLRYLLKNELNRPNDMFINGGVWSGTYTSEFNIANTNLFSKYKTDVMHVMLGTNDIAANSELYSDTTGTKVKTYINDNITKVYDQYKAVNPNSWLLISSIPTFYMTSTSLANLNTAVKFANEQLKAFAQNKNDVLYINTAGAIDKVIETNIPPASQADNALMGELFAPDRLHFNTSGYAILTKQLLSNLGFDYSKSKFYNF